MEATKDGRLSSSHHFGLLVKIPTKKNLVMITQFLKKCTITVMETWSRCRVLGKLSRAQYQGLQFWQTKSHAIIAHSPVRADCIFRVISQNGDRILFERLSTPRPAPKVTLKSNWHSQQHQESICNGVSTSTRRLVRERQAGIRAVRGYTKDDQTSTSC